MSAALAYYRRQQWVLLGNSLARAKDEGRARAIAGEIVALFQEPVREIKIPERATVDDPRPKPPEAGDAVDAVDGAGSRSEAAPAERGGGPATSQSCTPGDTGKAGRAGEAGGSPAALNTEEVCLAAEPEPALDTMPSAISGRADTGGSISRQPSSFPVKVEVRRARAPGVDPLREWGRPLRAPALHPPPWVQSHRLYHDDVRAIADHSSPGPLPAKPAFTRDL